MASAEPSSIAVVPPSGSAPLLDENENVLEDEFAVNSQLPGVGS